METGSSVFLHQSSGLGEGLRSAPHGRTGRAQGARSAQPTPHAGVLPSSMPTAFHAAPHVHLSVPPPLRAESCHPLKPRVRPAHSSRAAGPILARANTMPPSPACRPGCHTCPVCLSVRIVESLGSPCAQGWSSGSQLFLAPGTSQLGLGLGVTAMGAER